MNEKYNTSFRCFFQTEDGMHYSTHYQPQFSLADIPRWVDSYRFTHPNCVSISCKLWFGDSDNDKYAYDED